MKYLDLNMTNNCTFWMGVKNLFLNFSVRTTSKLIQSDQ